MIVVKTITKIISRNAIRFGQVIDGKKEARQPGWYSKIEWRLRGDETNACRDQKILQSFELERIQPDDPRDRTNISAAFAVCP